MNPVRLQRVILLICFVAACSAPPTIAPTVTAAPPATSAPPTRAATPTPASPAYLDATLAPEERAADLLGRMTLAEKIGQMTQVEKNSVKPGDIKARFIGSILSGGGGSPATNTAADWAKMTDGFQHEALQTRLAIPLIYGVDAVHGHGNLRGATIFPHNVGLGAANDAALMEQIGRATAEEMAATGIWWNFGPVLAVPQDIRWGRTYEAYGENTDLVAKLGAAYIRGLQNRNGATLNDPLTVLATAKHYIGDGGTTWGSSTTNGYKLDQGDVKVDEASLRSFYLPPYEAAVKAGVQSVMVSFSSWQGTKMHAQKHLLTDVLKGELGFKGFLVSDWQAIDQISPDYYKAVVTSINAGLDMVMVPYDYGTFITTLTKAVGKGDVSRSRIDDAVLRILTVKFKLGLFEHPYADPKALVFVGSDAHKALARQAVAESLVLLKNAGSTLPLDTHAAVVFVAGNAADDIGAQSGGWTVQWQGSLGATTPGTTILKAIRAVLGSGSRIEYSKLGDFSKLKDAQGKRLMADVGIVIQGEAPYAEGVGDRADLNWGGDGLVDKMRPQARKLLAVIVSGRPVIITPSLPKLDAVVAAWLPGTEGGGVADVLFGYKPFTGKLSYTWPRWNNQLPFDFKSLATTGCDAPLFSFGYGLAAGDPSPELPDCPAH